MDDRKMHNNAPNMKYYIEPEKPFYKKIPVVPAIILLILIGAWAFRWDYKTTQTRDDIKIIHSELVPLRQCWKGLSCQQHRSYPSELLTADDRAWC